jgi:hypothetical protein
MARRGAITILLITAERILRADLSGGRVTGLWQQPRPAIDDIPLLVDTALRLGGRRRRRVWVLTTDLWTQVVPIQVAVTRGMSNDELARALAFEAEPLSGMSAFESSLAHKPLQSDGFHQYYWVLQIPSWQLTQVEETVRQYGGTFGGMAHPGGMPRPVSPSQPSGSWSRVEFWPDSVIALSAESARPPDTFIHSGSPTRDDWKGPLASWLEHRHKAKHRELLHATTYDVNHPWDAEAELERLELAQESVLSSWLSGWGKVLAERKPAVPIVQPAQAPMKVETRFAMALGLAGLVAAGCWAWDREARRQMAENRAEISRLTERTEAFEAFDGQIQQRRERQRQLTEANEKLASDLDAYQQGLVAQRQRMATLLTAVAEKRPPDLMIQEIEQTASQVTIVGASLDPESANLLALRLDEQVRPLGWRVGIPRQQVGEGAGSRLPWTFQLDVRDAQTPVVTVSAEPSRSTPPLASRPQRGRPDRSRGEDR